MNVIELESKLGICLLGPPMGFAIDHGGYIEVKIHISTHCECCGKLWSEHDGISKDQLEEMKKFY